MKKEVMQQWVKALRSGKYKQCNGTLCKVDTKTEKRSFCCLGVLTELYLNDRRRAKKRNMIKGLKLESMDTWSQGCDIKPKWYPYWTHSGGEDGMLPTAVAEWAGMNTDCCNFDQDYRLGTFKDKNGERVSLSELNDGEEGVAKPKTFKHIAKIIETNYEKI